MMTDLYTLKPSKIILYGVNWCGDCRRARGVFSREATLFVDVDIDDDALGAAFVTEVNRGSRSVPTIIFPDGTVLVEPSDDVLAEKLRKLK